MASSWCYGQSQRSWPREHDARKKESPQMRPWDDHSRCCSRYEIQEISVPSSWLQVPELQSRDEVR
jgi:hypothetical protein